MSNANTTQVGGSHYKAHGDADLQHWDIVHKLKLDYFQGQITKYVIRWKDKNGLEDLHKAAHFLQKYIELHTNPELPPEVVCDTGLVKTFHVGEVAPTGWVQFSFEGGGAEGALYTCRSCKQAFHAPFDQNPHDYHSCHTLPDQYLSTWVSQLNEGGATPAYVNQD